MESTEQASAAYEEFMTLQRRVAETAIDGKPLLAADVPDDELWTIFVCGYGGLEVDPRWNAVQRTGHYAFRFQSLADSGGIAGYLEDVATDGAADVASALDAIGAAQYAAMFRMVVPLWENYANLPADTDPEKRQDAEDYLLTHDEYLDTEPPLGDFVRAYVIAHRADFFH
jgi:hypothetical protein